jgi:hypothetical protein
MVKAKETFGTSAFDRVTSEAYSEAIKWSKEVINTSPDSFELMTYEDSSQI